MFKRVDSEFTSTLQSGARRDETNSLLDVDDATPADRDALVADLREHTAVALVRETPSGYHLVTKPFDHNELTTDGVIFAS